MIGMENRFDFRPMVSQLVLAGEIKGFVGIRHEKKPQIEVAPESNFAYSRFDPIVKVVNATSSVSSLAELGATNMDIHQTYNGEKLPEQHVFTAYVVTMSFAAKFGRDGPIEKFDIGAGFKMTSEFDAKRRPLLKARHVLKTMRAIADTMVREKRFGEMDIELWKNGVKLASGRLKDSKESGWWGSSINSTVIDHEIS